MTLQADFDKISTLREPTWNNNIHYDKMLLECLGLRKNVLDVGCGTGRFSSKLKGQCDHVLGIDISTAMINKALKTHAGLQNLEFVQGDYLYTEFEPESFDAIISIATVHHMDFRRFLETAKHDLKPGGQLIILDLYQRTTPWELMLSMIALPVSRLLQLWYNGRFRPDRQSRAYWKMHAKSDVFMSFAEIAATAPEILPGADIKRLLFWRYLATWQKPA